jgi:hypothetical protein
LEPTENNGCGLSCSRNRRHRSRTKVPVTTPQLPSPPPLRGPNLYLQPPAQTEGNPSRMNTYAKRAANPRTMNTYKIIRLKVPWNQHLQKKGGVRRSYCYPAQNGNSSRTGVGCTCSPRKQRVWAVLAAHANNGCGPYLQPTQTIAKKPAAECRKLRVGTRLLKPGTRSGSLVISLV